MGGTAFAPARWVAYELVMAVLAVPPKWFSEFDMELKEVSSEQMS